MAKIMIDPKTREAYLRAVGKLFLIANGRMLLADKIESVAEGVSPHSADHTVAFRVYHNDIQRISIHEVNIEALREFYRANKSEVAPAFLQEADRVDKSSTVIAQITWTSERNRLRKRFEEEGVKAGGNYNNAFDPVKWLSTNRGAMTCKCPASVRVNAQLCDHVRWGYLFERDAILLDYAQRLERVPGNSLHFKCPIALGEGQVWVEVEMRTKNDGHSIFVDSTVEYSAARSCKLQGGGYVMTPGEGLIGYIQYLEDMLRQTPAYLKVVESYDPRLVQCSRQHRVAVHSIIRQALLPTNPYRDNWVIANAAMIYYTQSAQCLACSSLGVGQKDAPDF